MEPSLTLKEVNHFYLTSVDGHFSLFNYMPSALLCLYLSLVSLSPNFQNLNENVVHFCHQWKV